MAALKTIGMSFLETLAIFIPVHLERSSFRQSLKTDSAHFCEGGVGSLGRDINTARDAVDIIRADTPKIILRRIIPTVPLAAEGAISLIHRGDYGV